MGTDTVKPAFQFERRGCVIVLAALILLAAAWQGRLIERACGRHVDGIVADIRNDGPNESSLGTLTRNYYEGLFESSRGDDDAARGLIWSCLRPPPAPRDNCGTIVDIGATRPTDDLLEYEFVPHYNGTHKGARLRINQWGMRGPDNAMEKPTGVFRIAWVGGSNDMGTGVEDDDSYVRVIERRLNAELSPRTGLRYEILNFSAGGYFLVQRTWLAVTRTERFRPDLVIVVSTLHDRGYSVHARLARRVKRKQDLGFDFLRRFAAELKLKPSHAIGRLERRWGRVKNEIIRNCFAELRGFSQRSGIDVVVLALRLDAMKRDPWLLWIADEAERQGLGCLRVMDCYDRQAQYDTYLEAGDFHPSRTAHRLIADEAFGELSRYLEQ